MYNYPVIQQDMEDIQGILEEQVYVTGFAYCVLHDVPDELEPESELESELELELESELESGLEPLLESGANEVVTVILPSAVSSEFAVA